MALNALVTSFCHDQKKSGTERINNAFSAKCVSGLWIVNMFVYHKCQYCS